MGENGAARKRKRGDEPVESLAVKKHRGADDRETLAAATESTEPAEPFVVRITKVHEVSSGPPPIAILTPVGFEVSALYDCGNWAIKEPLPDGRMVLQSNQHPRMLYTAEEDPISTHTKHYLGLVDPKTSEMEAIVIKHFYVRGVPKHRLLGSGVEGAEGKLNYVDKRTDLVQAFGARKAKQYLKEQALNAVPTEKRGDGSPKKLDRAEQALMNDISEAAATMTSKEELDEALMAARPVPQPNLETDDVLKVYDPEVLIGEEILRSVPVQDWIDTVDRKEAVLVPSKFVAGRIVAIARADGPSTRLRLLRYYLCLVTFWTRSVDKGGKRPRKVPQLQALKDILGPVPDSLLHSIRRQFSEHGEMTKFHQDKLLTHACVYALLLGDGLEVDILDMQQELMLPKQKITACFQMIGAKLVRKRTAGQMSWAAQLSLPLHLPKQKMMAGAQRNKR